MMVLRYTKGGGTQQKRQREKRIIKASALFIVGWASIYIDDRIKGVTSYEITRLPTNFTAKKKKEAEYIFSREFSMRE